MATPADHMSLKQALTLATLLCEWELENCQPEATEWPIPLLFLGYSFKLFRGLIVDSQMKRWMGDANSDIKHSNHPHQYKIYTLYLAIPE